MYAASAVSIFSVFCAITVVPAMFSAVQSLQSEIAVETHYCQVNKKIWSFLTLFFRCAPVICSWTCTILEDKTAWREDGCLDNGFQTVESEEELETEQSTEPQQLSSHTMHQPHPHLMEDTNSHPTTVTDLSSTLSQLHNAALASKERPDHQDHQEMMDATERTELLETTPATERTVELLHRMDSRASHVSFAHQDLKDKWGLLERRDQLDHVDPQDLQELMEDVENQEWSDQPDFRENRDRRDHLEREERTDVSSTWVCRTFYQLQNEIFRLTDHKELQEPQDHRDAKEKLDQKVVVETLFQDHRDQMETWEERDVQDAREKPDHREDSDPRDQTETASTAQPQEPHQVINLSPNVKLLQLLNKYDSQTCSPIIIIIVGQNRWQVFCY